MALKHEAITKTILGGFYDIYNDVGWGFAESVYASMLAHAIAQRGLSATREQEHRVFYAGRCHGEFRSDLVVAGVVLVELKARPKLAPEHEAQLLNYLRVSGMEIGLLLNFGPKPQVKRLIWTPRLQRLDVL